jgi:WD40 repeat protein
MTYGFTNCGTISLTSYPSIWRRRAKYFRRHDGAVGGAAFSLDGVLLATISADATVRVWDAGTGASLTVLGGIGETVDVTFSPDGRELLTVSSDGIVCIYPLPAYGPISDMMKMGCRDLDSPECRR